MAIKVKAVERELKVGASAGQYRYMMQTELYSKLSQTKVIQEATLRSGIGKGTITRENVSVDYLKKLFAEHGVIVSAKPE